MTALRYGKQVFDQRDDQGTAKPHEHLTADTGRTAEDARFTQGAAMLAALNPEALPGSEGWDIAEKYAPGLHQLAVGHLYGDLLAGIGLHDPTRRLCLLSAVTALGGATTQLAFHIEAALNAGVLRKDIVAAPHIDGSRRRLRQGRRGPSGRRNRLRPPRRHRPEQRGLARPTT
ncbi:hypothetical protein PV350_23820 [Streptomyces sp. PA03-6a]|nr:hypothetical protein [Streptomyces sp. PA03-6a]